MKIVILILVIFLVWFGFKLFQMKLKSSNKQFRNSKEKIVDLEKDPNTDEYKPKE